MKKTDVARSYHLGCNGLPMVNVKVRQSCTPDGGLQRTVRKNASEFDKTRIDDFVRWLCTEINDEMAEAAWEVACEMGWEALQTNAEECFGPSTKVESAGRSSGWCVVHGLPNVDEWDAVILAKWARFEKWARQEVDNIPFAMADYLYLNIYLPPRQEAEEAARHDADAPIYMAL